VLASLKLLVAESKDQVGFNDEQKQNHNPKRQIQNVGLEPLVFSIPYVRKDGPKKDEKPLDDDGNVHLFTPGGKKLKA